MKSLKVLLGLGAACAVCCAVPLLGIAGGVGGLAAGLWACADEFLPAALALLVVASAIVALELWRRRRASSEQRACGCASQCSTGGMNANQ